MHRSFTRAFGAAVLTVSLAACGGGGGGSSALPPGAPKSPPSGPIAPSSTQQQQQAAVGAAAQEARVAQWREKYVGSSQRPQQTRRAAARLAAARVQAAATPSPAPTASPAPSPTASPTSSPSAAPCDSNQLTNVTQNADGSITIDQTGYYDECITLQYHSTLTLQAPDAGGKILGKGNETDYDTDGKSVTEYDLTNTVIYNANIGSGNMVMQVQRFASAAAANTPNAVPLDTDYFSEVDKAANVQQLGAASISADPQFPGGQFGTTSLYQTTITGGLYQTNTTIAETGATTNVQDQAGHLVIAQYPLAAGQAQWTLNGGHAISSTNETLSATYDTTGKELSYKDVIVDTADDITTTITGNIGGTQYTGVLTQTSTGSVLAKFVVDADGNGTITFANGSTLPVENWCWL